MERIYANSHVLLCITKQYVLPVELSVVNKHGLLLFLLLSIQESSAADRPKVALDLEHQYKVDSTVTWWADSHQQRRYGADKEKVGFQVSKSEHKMVSVHYYYKC